MSNLLIHCLVHPRTHRLTTIYPAENVSIYMFLSTYLQMLQITYTLESLAWIIDAKSYTFQLVRKPNQQYSRGAACAKLYSLPASRTQHTQKSKNNCNKIQTLTKIETNYKKVKIIQTRYKQIQKQIHENKQTNIIQENSSGRGCIFRVIIL